MIGTEMGLETPVIYNRMTFGCGCILLKTVFMITSLEYVSRLIALEDFINFGSVRSSDFTLMYIKTIADMATA
jgi:hypothetical protein